MPPDSVEAPARARQRFLLLVSQHFSILDGLQVDDSGLEPVE
jgi:hypothetical protein